VIYLVEKIVEKNSYKDDLMSPEPELDEPGRLGIEAETSEGEAEHELLLLMVRVFLAAKYGEMDQLAAEHLELEGGAWHIAPGGEDYEPVLRLAVGLRQSAIERDEAFLQHQADWMLNQLAWGTSISMIDIALHNELIGHGITVELCREYYDTVVKKKKLRRYLRLTHSILPGSARLRAGVITTDEHVGVGMLLDELFDWYIEEVVQSSSSWETLQVEPPNDAIWKVDALVRYAAVTDEILRSRLQQADLAGRNKYRFAQEVLRPVAAELASYLGREIDELLSIPACIAALIAAIEEPLQRFIETYPLRAGGVEIVAYRCRVAEEVRPDSPQIRCGEYGIARKTLNLLIRHLPRDCRTAPRAALRTAPVTAQDLIDATPDQLVGIKQIGALGWATIYVWLRHHFPDHPRTQELYDDLVKAKAIGRKGKPLEAVLVEVRSLFLQYCPEDPLIREIEAELTRRASVKRQQP
jgi:hypothetical protein